MHLVLAYARSSQPYDELRRSQSGTVFGCSILSNCATERQKRKKQTYLSK
jgi:hypothetical protein